MVPYSGPMLKPKQRKDETLTPRAASSSFSPCSVRCGVLADPFQDEGAMRFQHALAVSAHLAGRHRAGRTIARSRSIRTRAVACRPDSPRLIGIFPPPARVSN